MAAPRGWATAALVAASVVVAAGAGEVALRALRPEQVSPIVYPCFYEEDAQFGFRYRPDAEGRVAGHFEIDVVARTNSLGFHDDEPLPDGASEWRILAVGDSFTAGLNLETEELWTSVLERELRARGFPTADVVNLGLDGTGTDVHVDLLSHYAPMFGPDTVLVAFYANDVLDVLNGRFQRECYRGYALSYQDDLGRMTLRSRVDEHLERGLLRAAWERSYLARLALGAWLGARNPFRLNFLQSSAAELGIDDALLRQRAPRVAAAFRALERFAESCDCRVLVVPVPARRELDGSARVLARRAPDLALEVVDVAPALERSLAARGRPPADLFWVHDSHLNAAGNEAFGRALADALVSRAVPERKTQR